MQRRTFLVGVPAALAGCASVGGDGEAPPRDDGAPVQGGSGAYPHPIRVDNVLDRAVTVDLAVERRGTSLYSGTHEVGGGNREVVAGFTVESFPAEHRYVTVTASTAGAGAASAGLSVTGCLGDVLVSVGGEPSVSYTTCLDGEVRGPVA